MLDISYAMQIIGVHGVGDNKQTTRLLQDPGYWFGVQCATIVVFVNVQTKAGAQAYGANYRMVRGTVLNARQGLSSSSPAL